MLVVWLPNVIRFLFQALQIINLTWILHDGAVVGHGFWPKSQQQVCTFRIHGTLRYSSCPVVVFSMSVNLFLTTYKRRAPIWHLLSYQLDYVSALNCRLEFANRHGA